MHIFFKILLSSVLICVVIADGVIAEENLTNCVLADYMINEHTMKLLLIQYLDTSSAEKVQEKLQTVYLPDENNDENNIFRTKEKETIGLDRAGNYLTLVFEGKNRKDILWLLDITKSRLD